MNTHDATVSDKQPLPALTGLRFFAAVSVLIYHCEVLLVESRSLFVLASAAVSFFFVLSGFILTHVYANRLQVSGWPAFLVTRWARLWPLHIACLALSFILIPASQHALSTRVGLLKLATSVSLFSSWSLYPEWTSPFNPVAWSISTEFTFYLAFPLLLLIPPKFFGRAFLIAIFATFGLLVFLHQVVLDGDITLLKRFYYMNPVARIAEFICGMWVCYLFRACWKLNSAGSRWNHTLIECVSLVILVAWIIVLSYWATTPVFLESTGTEILWRWIRLSGGTFPCAALVIWVFASSNGHIARFLSSSWMIFLGEISFSLYMIHYVMLSYFLTWQIPDQSIVVTSLAVLAASIGLSTILFKLVEIPAKDSIVAFWKRDRQGIAEVFQGLGQLLRRPSPLVAGVGMIGLAFSIVYVEQKTQRIRENFAPTGDHIEFIGSGVLVSHSCESLPDGALSFTLEWRVYPDNSKRRFIHLTDNDGNIVRQLEDIKFVQSAKQESVLDRFVVPKEHLSGIKRIKVGFYSRESGMAELVVKGESDKDRRFCIKEFEDPSKL